MTRPLDDDPAHWIGRAYDRHAAGLFRYALMLLGDTASAADAVQQVFLAGDYFTYGPAGLGDLKKLGVPSRSQD